MTADIDALARQHNAYIKSDGRGFRHQARILQSIWRDHLLAGIHLIADSFEDGFFVFLYPQDNNYCSTAVAKYRSCLLNEDTFAAWTLKQVVQSLRQHTPTAWPGRFHD